MKIIHLLFLSILAYCQSYSQEFVATISPNFVTVLPASNAFLDKGLKTASYQNLDADPKVFAVQGWKEKNQSLSWNIKVVKKGSYRVAMLLLVKGLSPNAFINLKLSSKESDISLQSKNSNWDKIYFSEKLLLDTGIHHLQLQMADLAEGEHPDLSVYSLELATEKALKKKNATVESLRSKPKWLTGAKYGLFFHWNARSKPMSGIAKSYNDAAKDFDVTKFSLMVHETGADFIVFTTSWDLSTFPAPLKSLDNLLPGNTTSRDLIEDLAQALSKWNIKLVVYCNFRINKLGWKKEDRLILGKVDSSFSKLVTIYSEIGERYAKKIGGLWIDDGMGLYPHNAPFETLSGVIKKHDKNMVVGYNSWIYPRFTDLQDFFGGENGITLKSAGINNPYLPSGGSGYFTDGPQKGLKATFCGLLEPGDWTHTESEKVIPSPLLKAPELINIIKEGIMRKNVAIMNIRVYQDGTVSPETFNLLKELNKAVHN